MTSGKNNAPSYEEIRQAYESLDAPTKELLADVVEGRSGVLGIGTGITRLASATISFEPSSRKQLSDAKLTREVQGLPQLTALGREVAQHAELVRQDPDLAAMSTTQLEAELDADRSAFRIRRPEGFGPSL